MTNNRKGLTIDWNRAKKALYYKAPGWVWTILRTVVLIGLCFMILYPVLQLLTKSLMGAADMIDGSVVLLP